MEKHEKIQTFITAEQSTVILGKMIMVLRWSAGSLWSATLIPPAYPASPTLLQPPPDTSCGTHSPSPAAGEESQESNHIYTA